MQVKTEHLKAALLAAGKKDIRYYLNGVAIYEKHIVATDGHRMHVIAHGGEWPHGEVKIPREAVEMAVKLKLKTVEVTPEAIGPIAFKPLDGKFPDYTRVMPALSQGISEGPLVADLNPDYHKDAHAAIKLVTGEKQPALARVGVAWVWSNPQFCAVVMPYRTEDTKGWTAKPLQPLAA